MGTMDLDKFINVKNIDVVKKCKPPIQRKVG